MKLIESSVTLLQQEEGLMGIRKQIELAGRTCYKSEDKVTSNSALIFVDKMIESGHTAMLEHGTVYLHDTYDISAVGSFRESLGYKYQKNPYSRVIVGNKGDINDIYITTNFRVIEENGWMQDLENYLCEPTKFHVKRITLKFVTDRGVSHELVRHRVFSFAQESTRYCNYSKDKFGDEVTFIIPSWSPTIQEGILEYGILELLPQEASFMQSCYDSEKAYMAILNAGAAPQEARQVLPNALKTEIVMTGFVSDWKHFFDLRLLGTTGKPHPDMLLLAQKAKKVLQDNDLWTLIYPNNE